MSKDKDKDAAAEGAPKKSKKKLFIMVGALVVALAAGGGGYVMLAPKKAEAKPAPVAGKVAPLEAITVNLADGHFLKLKMSLQATAEAKELPDGSKAQNLAIDMFSNRTVAELSSNTERQRAKAELTEQVNKAYKEEVMDVYFTEFVMQ
jgi:flagellar FliL protein